MPRYMLDTDICSYIIRRSSAPVMRKLRNVAVGEVCISVVSKAELLYGVEVSPRHKQDEAAVELFLRHVQVLEFPDEAALHYATIRAHLKARGEMIASNDLFLAAHARSLGLVLVTNNTREFGRIPGLATENWTLSRS
jgi:tRNA(fMet)-specific endonuclease VapC